MNTYPAARGTQEARITQLRVHILAEPVVVFHFPSLLLPTVGCGGNRPCARRGAKSKIEEGNGGERGPRALSLSSFPTYISSAPVFEEDARSLAAAGSVRGARENCIDIRRVWQASACVCKGYPYAQMQDVGVRRTNFSGIAPDTKYRKLGGYEKIFSRNYILF